MGQGELEGCARAAVGSPVFPNLRCSDDVPTVDPDRADAGRWYTSKPCFPAIKSHISHLVGDSAWEGHAANVFEGRDEDDLILRSRGNPSTGRISFPSNPYSPDLNPSEMAFSKLKTIRREIDPPDQFLTLLIP
jgi:hypothetical protein